MANKIEFKIVKDKGGKDIELDNMSLPVARAFLILLQSLTNIVGLKTTKDVNIKILKGSAALVATGSDKIIDAIENDFNDVIQSKAVNKELVDNWRDIQSLFKENGLQYEANFISGNKKNSVFDKIKTQKKFRVRTFRNTHQWSMVFITGKLIAVGGQNPNIHINTENESITISCNEAQAVTVNKFLYQPIRISAWKKTKKNQIPVHSLCDFYINEGQYLSVEKFIKQFQKTDELKRLTLIHEIFRAHVEDGNLGVAAKLLRPFNNDFHEVSTLKTVLVVTKSFREEPVLKDLREEVKKKLEHKLGGPLI